MARIAGVDLPRDKRLEVALTYIYGIGRTRSKETLQATGISPDLRVKDATEEDMLPCVSTSRPTLRWRAIYDVRSRRISVARSKSAATRACVTVVAFRFAASAQRLTLAPVRVRSVRSPVRRSRRVGREYGTEDPRHNLA